ncbi:MAG: T9SS type A sorting domain-containing protein, partial [Ignavibacteriaceae bacterium]|nr:T9SS type A sorting domain-containing protein [Ignavibacteriaceae bacterium]
NQFEYLPSSGTLNEINELSLNLKFDKKYEINTSPVLVSKSLEGIILNYQDAERFAVRNLPSIASDTTYNWVVPGADYIKLGVGSEGIFRVYGSDIQNLGINLNEIIPANIQLIQRGNQVPFYLKLAQQNTFGLSDYIEFVGVPNFTPNELYRQNSGEFDYYWDRFDKYTDTTVYWLTFTGGSGLQVPLQNGNTGTTIDTLEYHSSKFHFENNSWFILPGTITNLEQPFYRGLKSWVWDGFSVQTRTYRNLTVRDVVPEKTFNFSAKVVSAALSVQANSHIVTLAVNNANLTRDSIIMPRYTSGVLTGTESTNVLTEGLNTVYVRNHANAAEINVCYTDWIDAIYPRYNNLRFGSLVMYFTETPVKQLKTIKLTSASDSTIVWKKSDSYTKIFTSSSQNSAYFNDSTDNNTVYYVAKDSAVLKPVIYYTKKMKNLRAAENQADLIIISHKYLMEGVSVYANATAQNTGLNVKIIDVDDIYDEFNYGFFSPEPIRDFLRMTHSNWQSPLPEYLYLIGAANYDYQLGKYKANTGFPKKLNLVPSYGAPVSDVFFSVWDTTGVYIPQFKTGRLPAKNSDEILYYLSKVNKYRTENFDDFNKAVILFSGGLTNDPLQIQQFKSVHDNVNSQLFLSQPYNFDSKHFYKTLDPITNFGPYTSEEITERIQRGGLFISYVGHSGTQTWDNSITDILQLRNSRNKSSLITDFGCSTTRFAEPDFTSFGELFVTSQSGQALGYIGNSSVGFSSTATTAPFEFYNTILNDSIGNPASALHKTKLNMIQKYGFSDVIKIFLLCNTYIGDPTIELKVPKKPNLVVRASDLSLSNFPVTNAIDSVELKFKVRNFGTTIESNFSVSIKSENNQTLIVDTLFSKIITGFEDSVLVKLPVKNYPGEHRVRIEVNPERTIEEYYYDDNLLNYSFFVSNIAVQNPLKYLNQSSVDSLLVFVNPGVKPEEEKLTLEFSNNPGFSNIIRREQAFSTFFTSLKLDFLEENKRFWFRIKNFSDDTFSEGRSFLKTGKNGYKINDNFSFAGLQSNNIAIQNDGVKLQGDTIPIFVMSAGAYDGFSAVIAVNNINYVLENTLGGHHVSVFNSADWSFKFARYFNFAASGPTGTESYKAMLDSLTENDILVVAVSDNGRITDAQLTARIKTFGSVKVDSMNGSFRSSWAMIGRKGAAPGSILEGFSRPFNGRVTLEDTVFNFATSGFIMTDAIGPSNNWQEIQIVKNEEVPGQIKATLFGGNSISGNFEDLGEIDISTGTNSLNILNQRAFNYSKIKFDLIQGAAENSPVVNSVSVNYSELPDIGLNYQSISSINDTLKIKEDLSIPFTVSNGGMSSATNFRVLVELRDPNDSATVIFNQDNISISALNRRDFVVTGKVGNKSGNYTLIFRVDPDNRINEATKDNNNYSLRFFGTNDSIAPEVKLTIDGNEIYSGDFISATPLIKVELYDDTDLSITDTTAIRIRLNEVPVFFSSPEVTYSFNQSNPKVVVEYKPKLSDGEYFLRVSGVNAFGIPADTSGLNKYFSVMNEPRILNVYNFPNPFKDDTYFTFRLSQIPDELKINIYTIAGRKIRTIDVPVNSTSYDFNKIYWDGRDEDGDQLANGVYIYRVIMKKGDKVERITEKLAIVR